MNKQFLLFLFAVVALCLAQCKHECDDPTDPECPNYRLPLDPCADTHPVSASFTISQYAGPGNDGLYIETQYHVTANKLVKLHANEEEAFTYKWIIGADTIYSQEYTFQFSTDFYDQIIALKLIIYKEPDTECWPDDNGRDTLIRHVHVQPACTASILGLYYGAWEDAPQDSFYISFRVFDSEQFPGVDCSAVMGRGLNGDFNDSCRVQIGGNTNNYVRIANDDCSYHVMGDPWGEFYLYPEENRIYADYYFSIEVDGSPEQQFKKFNGRKIY